MADDIASLKKKIAAIPPSVRAAAVAALDKDADELVSSMRALSPVRSGKLRESIHKEPGSTELQVKVVAGGQLTTKEVREGSGKPYDYAKGVEWGTHEMAAEPYFFPAYRLLKKRLRSRVKRAITKAAKEAWRA
ncbi:HK97-gp10 family putative phage morphogenesis protein [Hyphomicrobium sp. MC1]|uniref:HK97-gp10 family putative phage morphogenesis protein n=1 Tax=Hyphomicrobium sp. (strain MC1) TaxID=717785 RepID=UPI000213EB29|nr:HK97-gp10 family putative phage morphogenesis protein [Hyphomicrobium sp. MC1]CCB65396.1 Phage protein, HK97 gp10 family [Hyphomicrobium sp. MC1]